MKIIEVWILVTVWLAMHNSINDRAADVSQAGRQREAAAMSLAGESQGMPAVLPAAQQQEIGAALLAGEETAAGTGDEQAADGDMQAEDGDTEAQPKTEAESAAKGEAEPGTEEGTVGEESESETEGESASGEETKPETEEESTLGEESESETEGESAPEEEKKIRITGMWAAYEEETRIYDGTAYVCLKVEAQELPQGIALYAWGEAEEAGVGQWEVTPFFSVTGEGAEEYELSIEAAYPSVTIVPRPLTIRIGDAQKDYYAENTIESLDFLEEDEKALEITGFVEGEEIPPEFCEPELAIDEEVLKRQSPMYENGKLKEYEGAVVVKLDREGKPTGNPGENYCFVLDAASGFYEPGSVVLRQPAVVGTLDYTLTSPTPGAMYRDETGILWVRKGTVLAIEPEKGRGFTETVVTAPLEESGTFRFSLQRKSDKGELLAKSQAQQFSFRVDEAAPTGGFEINQRQGGSGVYFSNGNVTVRLAEAADRQSGLASVKLYLDVSGGEKPSDFSRFYQETAGTWEERREWTLAQEGSYRVYARMEDHVGNVAYLESEEICIDRTAPGIQILEPEMGSANNGTVAPVVVCSDANYKEGSLQVTLEGSSTGTRAFGQVREKKEQGETVRIEDIPRERKWDDLYVLRASAQDMAGNEAEKKIVFSINRYGSVFKVDRKVQSKLEKYYIQEPVDLVISEFNVDAVSRSRIYVGCGEEIRILREGEDYQVTASRSRMGWRVYRYVISAANFRREGFYYVVITTRDRAGNAADNRLQRQSLEFAVDRTEPSIIITGIENGAYPAESRTAEIECRDNIALKQVQIYVNGGLAVQNCEENQQFTLTQGDEWQKLEVRAKDCAGNAGASEALWVYLGSDEKKAAAIPEAVRVQESEKKAEDQGEQSEKKKGGKELAAAFDANTEEIIKRKNWAPVLPGVAGFALLGVYFYKNKWVK